MRIAVLSDTHLFSPNDRLITEFEARLQYADALLHLGDITAESVLGFLASHPAFYAVAGNMDSGRWAMNLPAKRIIELNGTRIGMLHGAGLGFGNLEAGVRASFDSAEVDLVCFGHTHRRLWRSEQEPRLLNPGSFSLPKDGPAGYAVVHTDGPGGMDVEWVRIEEA